MMRFSIRWPRRAIRSQSGFAIVEVVVASGLLGIGVVAGLTAVQAAQYAGKQAVAQAKDQCLVQVEVQYIGAAPYGATYSTVPGVTVSVAAANPNPGSPMEQITISHGSYSTQIYKAYALSPYNTAPVSTSATPYLPAWPAPDASGCPS